MCGYSRPLFVGRQFQGRKSFELFSPVLHFAFQHFTLKPVSLPDCIICVLDRKLRQGAGAAVMMFCVQVTEFADQNPERPSITHYVVQSHKQNVFLFCGAHQGRSVAVHFLNRMDAALLSGLAALLSSRLAAAKPLRSSRVIATEFSDPTFWTGPSCSRTKRVRKIWCASQFHRGSTVAPARPTHRSSVLHQTRCRLHCPVPSGP